MLRALLFLLASAVAACMAGAQPTVVTVPVTSPVGSTPIAEPPKTCGAHLTAKQVNANSSTCFVDARVRDGVGELVYPCAGGEAEARFASARFSGSVSDGLVDLTLSTTFDFEDGCHWVSHQQIRGMLSAPALEYGYTEEAAPGQSGCASPCTAQAMVAVAPVAGPSGGPL